VDPGKAGPSVPGNVGWRAIIALRDPDTIAGGALDSLSPIVGNVEPLLLLFEMIVEREIADFVAQAFASARLSSLEQSSRKMISSAPISAPKIEPMRSSEIMRMVEVWYDHGNARLAERAVARLPG